jgi:polar amino acid transport system substrate-binding protein
VAYVEEPPFYWAAADGSAAGADVELARVVLTMIGETSIEFVPIDFDELLSTMIDGRWDMNVPIFITPERERRVTFSVPVWSLSDGFVVRRANPKSLTSYSSVGLDRTARLGPIPGQVQFGAATAAGVPSDQIVTFVGQSEAVVASQ